MVSVNPQELLNRVENGEISPPVWLSASAASGWIDGFVAACLLMDGDDSADSKGLGDS